MNTKHTPGPWQYKPAYSKGYLILHDQKVFGLVNGLDKCNQEIEANAQLIAAAPDLLDALQSILDFPPSDLEGWATGHDCVPITLQPHHIQKALDAIKKATS